MGFTSGFKLGQDAATEKKLEDLKELCANGDQEACKELKLITPATDSNSDTPNKGSFTSGLKTGIGAGV